MRFTTTASSSKSGGNRNLGCALTVAAVLALATLGSADDTFVVDTFADLVEIDPVDIACQTAAGTCSLRAAVMQANVNPGDTTILLPAGLFALTRLPSGPNDADSGDLNLAKSGPASITIVGAGAGATIVDGGDLDRIFRVQGATFAWIRDLTVRNGSAVNGGGILAEGDLILTGVRIAENVASQRGGGLSVGTTSFVTVEYTDVIANQATQAGGGIYLSENADGDFSFAFGEIRDNSAQYGGGLHLFGSASVAIQFAWVHGNEAEAGGGLAFVDASAEVYLQASTIDGNHAAQELIGFGGGIYNVSTLHVVNSTISANSATQDGGGIANFNATTLYNTTVAFNEADFGADPNGGRGGGLFNDTGGTLAIRNSVLAGNYRSGAPIPDDCFGNLHAYGHNRFTSFDGCAIAHTGACGGTDELLAAASELGPLQANGGATPTHEIQAGSSLVDDVDAPCLCQGPFGDPLAVDQRDGPRVVGARCDVGAFERGALPPGALFSDGFESGGLWLWN